MAIFYRILHLFCCLSMTLFGNGGGCLRRVNEDFNWNADGELLDNELTDSLLKL